MNSVRKKKVSFLGLMVIMIAVFCIGCQREQGKGAQTPAEAAELAMKSLQKLDFQMFNQYTDNYVCTKRNWLGVPQEREYQMFQELQQPGLFRGKRYKANRRFAENIMEKLSWELVDVEISGETALVSLRITNTDLTDVMGYYMIQLMERMIEGEGTGLGEMVATVSRLSRLELGELFGLIDELQEQDGVTREVQLRAEKREDAWRLCLNEEFIRAVMGNMDSEEFSPEIEEQLEQLEERYEEKMEQWGEELEEKIESWTEPK